MRLDSLSTDPLTHLEERQEPGAAELFGQAALYELNQAARGLTQPFGLERLVGEVAKPEPANSWVGEQFQMLGSGMGGLLPTALVALGTRYGFGKAFTHFDTSLENIMLRRSVVGLSIAESATTGLVSGAIFHPTEEEEARNWRSLALDRATNSLSSAASFSLLTATTFGMKALADTKFVTDIGLSKVAKSSLVTGALSGIPGGFANVELDSLARRGEFSSDGSRIATSIYQMSVIGGVFGLSASGLAHISKARAALAPVETSAIDDAPALTAHRESPDATAKLAVSGSADSLMMTALESLSKNLGHDSPAMQRILELHEDQQLYNRVLAASTAYSSPESTFLPEVAQFIEEQPLAPKEFVASIISDASDWRQLNDGRLQALAQLQAAFGDTTPGVSKILKIADGGYLQSLTEWVTLNPSHAVPFVNRVLDNGATERQLSGPKLQAAYALDSVLDGKAETIRRILELEDKGLDTAALARYITTADAGTGRQARVQKMIDENATAREIRPDRLRALDTLGNIFGESAPIMDSFRDADRSASVVGVIPMVEQLKEQAVPYLTKLHEHGLRAEELTVNQLSSLTRLEQQLAPTDAQFKNLFRFAADFDASALELLTRFIEEAPEQRKDLIVQKLNKDTDLDGILPSVVLANLAKEFSDDSPIVNRMRDLPKNVLVSWLEIKPGDSTYATLAKVLNYNVGDKALSAYNVKAFEELERALAPDSALLQKVLDLQSKDLPAYESRYLANFLKSSDEAKKAAVAQILQESTEPNQVRSQRIEDLLALNAIFGEGSSTMRQILTLESQGLELGNLTRFLGGSDIADRQLVKTLIDAGAKAPELDSYRLESLKALNARFGTGSAIMQRLCDLEKNGLRLDRIETFIEDNPDSNQDLIASIAESGASGEKLQPGRLKAINVLKALFGETSPTMRRFYEQEERGLDPRELFTFLNSDEAGRSMRAAKSLVGRLLDQNAPVRELSADKLTARIGLQAVLNDASGEKYLQKMIEKGVDLPGLYKFIESEPSHLEIVRTLLDQGASAKQLAYTRLQGLQALATVYGADSQTLQQLLTLESKRFRLSDLAAFANQSETNANDLRSLVEVTPSGRIPDAGSLRDRVNLKKLSRQFGDAPETSPVIERLRELQAQSLSALRLANFIDEAPASRSELVKRLVSEGADAKRFNTQISLSIFPDNVAYRLAEHDGQDGMSVARVIAHTKNWHSGPQFRDLLTAHVESGGKLSSSAVEDLLQSAKTAPSQPAREPMPTSTDTSRPVEKMPETRTLETAAARIRDLIPAERPVVLLGRDTWPLLPLLRAQGQDVQYFLWTRLQIGDARTAAQWLKEVPPGAAVIDTGFRGSVIDAVRDIDPSASGYLLESLGHYPQLLAEPDGAATGLESYPKMIGRSRSYTSKGGAISRHQDRDECEGFQFSTVENFQGHQRWVVETQIGQLLRSMNVTDWERWRFKNYLGLTPSERLFLNSSDEVQKHYNTVAAQRERASFP